MDEKERDAQEALGCNKTFRVSFKVPLSLTGSHTIEINAVSEEDARERAESIIDTMTEKQIVEDCIKKDNSDGPQLFGSRHTSGTTIDGSKSRIKINVHELKEPTGAFEGSTEMSAESSG